MRELLIQLTMVTVCVTIIWAWLQAPQRMADSLISAITKGRIRHVGLRKPFGCELCMTFWLCIALCLHAMPFTLTGVLQSVAMSLAAALSTKYLLLALSLADTLLCRVAELIERLFTKI